MSDKTLLAYIANYHSDKVCKRVIKRLEKLPTKNSDLNVWKDLCWKVQENVDDFQLFENILFEAIYAAIKKTDEPILKLLSAFGDDVFNGVFKNKDDIDNQIIILAAVEQLVKTSILNHAIENTLYVTMMPEDKIVTK